jgi:hypothetical protein
MTTTPPGPRLPGTSLYDTLLPRIQAINEEGGNMVSHLMSRPVLDMVDSGADTDPDLSRIRAKIHEAITAHQHKRDHKRFSAIFNAYSEALVYFSLRARGLDVHVLPEGDDKTPDFLTRTKPVVGLELKTIDVHSPGETYEAAMDRGFESAYEALERARAMAKSDARSVGVGTSSSSYAPHGEGAGPKEVMIQTIRKIRGNIKAGQYKGHPTILVVSLVRLGVREDGVELRRWQEEDEDFGGRANGHLYTIAAHQVGDSFSDYGRQRGPEPYDLGSLNEAGILLDHPFIAGIVFMETAWHETDSPEILNEGVRFNGVWNSPWEADSAFTEEEKAETKRCFAQLCHAWNDTEDSRRTNLPDVRKLQAGLAQHLRQFTREWEGRTPEVTALQAFMVEADHLYTVWKSADLSLDMSQHTPIDPASVVTGHSASSGQPVISYVGPSSHSGIPKLEFTRGHGGWLWRENVDAVKLGAIEL